MNTTEKNQTEKGRSKEEKLDPRSAADRGLYPPSLPGIREYVPSTEATRLQRLQGVRGTRRPNISSLLSHLPLGRRRKDLCHQPSAAKQKSLATRWHWITSNEEEREWTRCGSFGLFVNAWHVNDRT